MVWELNNFQILQYNSNLYLHYSFYRYNRESTNFEEKIILVGIVNLFIIKSRKSQLQQKIKTKFGNYVEQLTRTRTWIFPNKISHILIKLSFFKSFKATTKITGKTAPQEHKYEGKTYSYSLCLGRPSFVHSASSPKSEEEL